MGTFILQRMDYRVEIQTIIGENNLEVICNAIDYYQLTQTTIMEIARQMGGGRVYGTFNEKTAKGESTRNVFLFMLDTWYNEEIHRPEIDGFQKMVDILNHRLVAQEALARRMNPPPTAVLKIGLPDSHFKIHLEEQSEAGSLPYPSDQGQSLTCSSHAIGKAMLDILDKFGWNADQEEIIRALIAEVQPNMPGQDPNKQRRNPDKFKNVTIKINVCNKGNNHQNGDIYAEVGVQAFKHNIPVNIDLVANNVRMVLRWNMWNINLNDYDAHAIYADGNGYDTATERFSCINSWNNTQGFPKIHKSDIGAIYYITMKQVFSKP